MSEIDAVIQDLQNSLTRMTEERDYWQKVATTLAQNATAHPYTYYGRSVQYALSHAKEGSS
jgi:hypothetical protein